MATPFQEGSEAVSQTTGVESCEEETPSAKGKTIIKAMSLIEFLMSYVAPSLMGGLIVVIAIGLNYLSITKK